MPAQQAERMPNTESKKAEFLVRKSGSFIFLLNVKVRFNFIYTVFLFDAFHGGKVLWDEEGGGD